MRSRCPAPLLHPAASAALAKETLCERDAVCQSIDSVQPARQQPLCVAFAPTDQLIMPPDNLPTTCQSIDPVHTAAQKAHNQLSLILQTTCLPTTMCPTTHLSNSAPFRLRAFPSTTCLPFLTHHPTVSFCVLLLLSTCHRDAATTLPLQT